MKLIWYKIQTNYQQIKVILIIILNKYFKFEHLILELMYFITFVNDVLFLVHDIIYLDDNKKKQVIPA